MVKEMNFYRSQPTNDEIVRRERRWTRIYLFLLFTSLVCVTVYTTLDRNIVDHSIDGPHHLNDYEKLQNIHSIQLNCPCTIVSIPYRSVVKTLQVQSFHPICESQFLSISWLEYLRTSMEMEFWMPAEDFRQWAADFFNAIRKLCLLAKQTIDHELSHFMSSTLITDRLISKEMFDFRMNQTIEYLIANISRSFLYEFYLIRLMGQGNGLIDSLMSNWIGSPDNRDPMQSRFNFKHKNYPNRNCSCTTFYGCVAPASLYEIGDIVFYTVPGIKTSCTILESVFHSTLECFSSQVYFSEFLNALPLGTLWTIQGYLTGLERFSPLDLSNTSYSQEDTFETIFNRIFIDSWLIEISYDQFFELCSPSHCIYTSSADFDLLLVITTLLSAFGGLTVTLHAIIPSLARCLSLIKSRSRVTPMNSISNYHLSHNGKH